MSECEKAFEAFQLSTRTLYSRTVDIEHQAFEAGWQAYQQHLRELAQSVPPIEVSQEAIAAAEQLATAKSALEDIAFPALHGTTNPKTIAAEALRQINEIGGGE